MIVTALRGSLVIPWMTPWRCFIYWDGPRRQRSLAVTCTFGNGTTEQVYRASRDLLSEAGWERLPVICGSSQGEEPVSDAARFIVEETRKKPGELSFVGIGSLTNLYGASLLDPGIFDRLKEIVLMAAIQRLYCTMEAIWTS